MKRNNGSEIVIPEDLLGQVGGGASYKPANCGNRVDQYAVKPGQNYYYHYTGGGHDNWLIIHVDDVREESKHILWLTERFAYVTYANGATGKLPLDTEAVYAIL